MAFIEGHRYETSRTMKNKLPEPYELKHTSVGWWVDGYCGYLFVGYFDTEHEAITAFWETKKKECYESPPED